MEPAAGRCGLAGDVTRPPCDPSDRTETGHEGDDGGRTVECAPTRAGRARAGLVAAAAEPSASAPARLGQHLRRAGARPHRPRAAARPAGQLAAGRRPVGVRGGCDDLAALRRRMLPCAGLLLPPLAPFGRPADHRRLGLPVGLPARLRARLVDRAGRRPPAAPLGRHRPHRRSAGPRAAGPAARRRAGAAGRVRRRLRLRAAVPRPRRPSSGGAGAAQVRPLLLRRPATAPTWRHRPAAPPRRQARLRRPTTWPAPTATLVASDEQYGTVTVQAWAGLHPTQQRHPGRGSGGPRPIVRGTILRVAVERVPARTRPPKVGWLWWAGPPGCTLDLDLAWRGYARRFDLEHTIRFAKQTLGWATPRPRHPAQADRWSWLVLACSTQLRLARDAVADQRLPWERPRPQPRLSPVRVRRGFPQLLAALGTPASAPKPAGRSPGRPKGSRRGPATRHPAIKKPAKRPRKKPSKAAKAA